VVSVLMQMITDGKVKDDIAIAYEMSKEWKRALYSYKTEKDLSTKELASRLTRNGKNVSDTTIRNWFDEDSHTVGPREEDSIKQIGELTGNEQLVSRSKDYFDACHKIRLVRMKILSQVGLAIINKLSGNAIKDVEISKDIYDRIDDLAVVLQIERLTPINKVVPTNITNRPIYM